MTDQKISIRQEIKAYHLDNGLLFQFILSEFFAAVDIAQSENNIEKVLERLIGHHEEALCNFSWRPEYAILTKLRNFCTHFADEASADDKTSIAMQEYADQAWLIASHMATILKRNGKKDEAIQKNLEKLNKILAKLGRVILKALTTFKLNENVLFYLLRHHKHIKAAFGLTQSNQLFKRLFKEGVKEAVQFMTSRYAIRGFQQIIPIISSRAKELDIKL